MKLNVEVKDLEKMTIAYVRNIGPFAGNAELFADLFRRLCAWAGPRELIGPDTKMLSVYHDDPNVTDEAKLRLDIAMSIDPAQKVDGEIGKQDLPGGKYAVAHFELRAASEYQDAWNAFYHDWLASSGYQPDQRPSLEIYLNDPNKDPEGKHIVEFCIPVKPL